MLKLPITYRDLDGNEQTEEHYFNLRIDEVAEMDGEFDGGLEGYLKALIDKRSVSGMVAAFKRILQAAYGRRSADGKRFTKHESFWQEFVETEAFGALLLDLMTDAEKMANFIKGALPADFEEKIAKLKAAKDAQEALSENIANRMTGDYTHPQLQPKFDLGEVPPIYVRDENPYAKYSRDQLEAMLLQNPQQ